jgi:hypothetical protein
MNEMSPFPCHGKLDCTVCFPSGDGIAVAGQWKIRNDPGYYGSSNPRTLVLGFSKGSTQADVYATGVFEDVPFAKCRPRLASALRIVGVLAKGDSVENKFYADESDLAFASLVRCSLARWDERSKGYSTSGPIVGKAFKETEARRFTENCAKQFLSRFPERLRLIIMLGVDDNYIKNCRTLVGRLHQLRTVNHVSYTNGQVTWVHVIHPSPANGHFESWVSGDAGRVPMGRKRELAKVVVQRVLGTCS